MTARTTLSRARTRGWPRRWTPLKLVAQSGCAALLASCATQPAPIPTDDEPTSPIARIQQLADGRWGLCTTCEPATPKTLGARQLVAAQAVGAGGPRPQGLQRAPEGSVAEPPPAVPLPPAPAASTPHATAAPSPDPGQARPLAQPAATAPGRDANPRVRRIERAVIGFAFNGQTVSELSDEGRARLRALVPLLQRAQRVRFVGFTDNIGTQANNETVANARALAVLTYTRSLLGDAAPVQMSANGRALCCYIDSNAGEEGRRKNRRVALVIELADTAANAALIQQHARWLETERPPVAADGPKEAMGASRAG